MLIKSADDKTTAAAELEALYESAPREKKAVILQELKNLRAGTRGERESAYELDFYIAKSNNVALIHDLRLEIDGRVAQIDHVFINRLMEVYVVETKHFSQGLSINERGEFMAWYNGRAVGIPSPLSQNDRHLEVLRDALKQIQMPKRLGFTLNPSLRSLVMISKNAKISRPADAKFDSSNVMKADQFSDWYDKAFAKNTASLAKLVSSDTIVDIANQLAAMHRPIAFNYRGKFGLAPAPAAPPATSTVAPTVYRHPPLEELADEVSAAQESSLTSSSKYTCAKCDCGITYVVAKFCWSQKQKFGGEAYCRDCQPKVGQVASAVPVAAAMPPPAAAQALEPIRSAVPPSAPASAPAPTQPSEPAAETSKYSCAECECGLPYAVAKFCWLNKLKFGGKVYCRDCQAKVSAGLAVGTTSPLVGQSLTAVALAHPAPAAPPMTNSVSAEDPANKYTCAGCPTKVPYAVARFCWNQKAKFGGVVYCRECQKNH